MSPSAPASSLGTRLLRALAPARSREDAAAAIERVHADQPEPQYALRAALAAVLEQPGTSNALAFTAYEAARDALATLDATLDRVVLAAVASDPVDNLARELATGLDAHRLERTLSVAFDALAPPNARARAVLIDLLRAHPLTGTRVAIYRHLVSRDTDVRAPLADDNHLDPGDRLEVLSAFAAQIAAHGRRLAIRFDHDATTSLARTLADWTRYSTHPRQIVFAFERHVGDATRAAESLTHIERWSLPEEVRAWLAAGGAPVAARARSLGAGRYECAQCGAATLLAKGTRPIHPDEPSKGFETVYACRSCGTEHHASWNASANGSEIPLPEAWLVR